MALQASQSERITACICCNGELPDISRARLLAGKSEILIAADNGAQLLAAMNLKPHAIIGDMDSLINDPWQNDPHIRRIQYPQDKDRSDTELAIEWAFDQGAANVLLLAATGGRLDHVLGHCALLIKYPAKLAIWDNGFLVQALTAGQQKDISTFPNALISLIPFAKPVRVTTGGTKYDLSDGLLDHVTHGLSNVVVEKKCSVSISQGLILLCAQVSETWPD